MIFIITGTQKFQFNRLLKGIDILNKKNKISHEIFAQIGHSTYLPNTYNFVKFLSDNEFRDIMFKADLIITHGGSAAITTALKFNKKVLAIPRLRMYKEHVDDHQIEIVNKLKQQGLIETITDVKDMESMLKNINHSTFNKFKSNTDVFIKSIEYDINIL